MTNNSFVRVHFRQFSHCQAPFRVDRVGTLPSLSIIVHAMATNRIPVDQWTDPRHRDGWQGEILAAEWLQRRGWCLESHRFALGHHDVDLIIRRGPLVAFVEVKVRRSLRFGAGEEAVSPRKRRIIEHLAWAWILRHGRSGDQYRFDVVSLAGPGPGVATLRHIEDAWRPGWR